MAELKPCPFCGCAMRVESSRDWHRPVGNHDDSCMLLDEDFVYPADNAGLAELVEDWNRRATDGQREGVPEGWKVVPVEPDMGMVTAAEAAYRRSKRLLGTANAIPAAIGAAIAAAPTPQAHHQQQQHEAAQGFAGDRVPENRDFTSTTPPAGEAGQERGDA